MRPIDRLKPRPAELQRGRRTDHRSVRPCTLLRVPRAGFSRWISTFRRFETVRRSVNQRPRPSHLASIKCEYMDGHGVGMSWIGLGSPNTSKIFIYGAHEIKPPGLLRQPTISFCFVLLFTVFFEIAVSRRIP